MVELKMKQLVRLQLSAPASSEIGEGNAGDNDKEYSQSELFVREVKDYVAGAIISGPVELQKFSTCF